MSVNIFRKEHVPERRSKTDKRSDYSISERFLTAMELPGDLACKAPIITITGPTQVLIENYKSILSYTSEQLIVVTCQGRVILHGKNLEIFRYTSLEMEVRGKIMAVMLECR
ncbi:YabP/YqfC family sporulation protein [Blautia sp. Sow4_E7]|uniref:YabP/YqfC family sporulation protein n=1 Tax=Blautia sp. Sow4_E7 TaxID=3438749 RepID=UPI003F8E8A57